MRMILVSGLMLVVGCGLEEIKIERAAIADANKTIMLKVIDKSKIDQSQITADGSVINPKYEYTWFGGTGIYSVGTIQAIGVDIRASARAAGVGEGEPDQDMREKIYEMLNRRDINENDRKDKIIELLFGGDVPTTMPVSTDGDGT